MTRASFICYPFGRPSEAIYINADSLRSARDLAAYRFGVHRSMVSVRREPADARGFLFVTF